MTDEIEKVDEPEGNPKPEATQPKRRWFQYSIRSLMLVTLVIACWLGYISHNARKQRNAVEELEGWVRYDYELNENGEYIEEAQPPGPDWLREWIGIDYFCDVVHVRTQTIDISPLESLTSLNSLSLVNIQAEDYSPLSGLTKLKTLFLGGSKFNDLSILKRMTNLDYLGLSSTDVTDLYPLQDLTNLRELSLAFTQINDISPLKSLTKLEKLYLNNTPVSNISPLKSLTRLRNLSLRGTQIKNLMPLEGLTNLNYLEVYDTPVTKEEVQKLQKKLPNCEIVWYDN